MISKARVMFENNEESELTNDESAVKNLDLAIDALVVKTVDDALMLNSKPNSARPTEEKQDDKKVLTPYVIRFVLTEATGLPKSTLLNSSEVYATLSWFPKPITSNQSKPVTIADGGNLEDMSNSVVAAAIEDSLRYSNKSEQQTTLVKCSPTVHWDPNHECFYFHGSYFNDPLENNADYIQQEV
jgi:hypothetical protein